MVACLQPKLTSRFRFGRYLVQSATGFSDPAQPKIFVDTPDDPHGEVLITDVSIQAGWGNDGAVMMRWRVGPASGMWDVHINISHNVHVGLHVTGSGAGYGCAYLP